MARNYLVFIVEPCYLTPSPSLSLSLFLYLLVALNFKRADKFNCPSSPCAHTYLCHTVEVVAICMFFPLRVGQHFTSSLPILKAD